jgi:hypothetical protein
MFKRHELHYSHQIRETDMANFAETSCSQCGKTFGPGPSGYSHCDQHRLYAHYFAGRGRAEVIITKTPSLRGRHDPHSTGFVASENVNGKREARAVAATYNAKPWNF